MQPTRDSYLVRKPYSSNEQYGPWKGDINAASRHHVTTSDHRRDSTSWSRHAGAKRPFVSDAPHFRPDKRPRPSAPHGAPISSARPERTRSVKIPLPRRCHKGILGSNKARQEWAAAQCAELQERHGFLVTYQLLPDEITGLFQWHEKSNLRPLLAPNRPAYNRNDAGTSGSANHPDVRFLQKRDPSDAIQTAQENKRPTQPSLLVPIETVTAQVLDEPDEFHAEEDDSTMQSIEAEPETSEEEVDELMHSDEGEELNESAEASERSDDEDVIEIAAEEYYKTVDLKTSTSADQPVPADEDDELKGLVATFLMRLCGRSGRKKRPHGVYTDDATFSYQVNDALSFEAVKAVALAGTAIVSPRWVIRRSYLPRNLKISPLRGLYTESDPINIWFTYFSGFRLAYQVDAKGVPLYESSCLPGLGLEGAALVLTLHGTVTTPGLDNVRQASFDRSLVILQRVTDGSCEWPFQILSDQLVYRCNTELPATTSLGDLSGPRLQRDGTAIHFDRFVLGGHIQKMQLQSPLPRIRLPMILRNRVFTSESKAGSLQAASVLTMSTHCGLAPAQINYSYRPLSPNVGVWAAQGTGRRDVSQDAPEDDGEDLQREDGQAEQPNTDSSVLAESSGGRSEELARMRAELERLQVHSQQLQREIDGQRTRQHPVSGASLRHGAPPTGPRSGRNRDIGDRRMIRVLNLHTWTNPTDLESFFNIMGDIQIRMRFEPPRGDRVSAMVTFPSEQLAESAVRSLNGMLLHGSALRLVQL